MTSEELDLMERLWREGVPTKQIARRLGYSDHTVRTRASRDRARFPYRRKRRGRDAALDGMVAALEAAGRREACDACFLACAARRGTGAYPCDEGLREWAREHRDDPGLVEEVTGE